MKILSHIRRHLGWKLLFSYIIVILVGVFALIASAELAIPSAFDRHLAAMQSMMQGNAMMMNTDLFDSFSSAFNEALLLATLVSFGMAVLVSLFVSRQVVAPVRAMMQAAQRIAEGHYQERVHIPGDIAREELDELAQLAVRFNQMAARLEQTEQMRRQLIGDVAHELRTPLATIKGSMEGLIDGVLPPQEETFQMVYQEADRLGRLVKDLQELSRVEARAFELHTRPVRISDLLSAALVRLGRQFEEKGVTLENAVPEDLPMVRVDEDRLSQVLLNLLGNALQYTPSGGKVNISAFQKEGYISVAIADTGVGIPAEHLPHLFTRFYRVDKSRARPGGGSGIGLTIARHLVEAHGGRITADSPGPGLGSTFTLTLPLASRPESTA